MLGLKPPTNFPARNIMESAEALDLLPKKRLNEITGFLVRCIKVCANLVAPGDPFGFSQRAADKLLVDDRKLQKEKKAEAISRILVAVKAMGQNSVESRTLKASLCAQYPQKLLQEVAETFDGDDFSWGLDSKSYAYYRKIFAGMCEGRTAAMAVQTRERFKPEVAELACDFILSEVCVKQLSWGHRNRYVYGLEGKIEEYTLPAVVRKMTVMEMYERYVQYLNDGGAGSQGACVSQRTFFNIAKEITATQDQARTCVDYVVSILIISNTCTVRAVVDKCVDPAARSVWHRKIDIMVNFLRYQYDSHVGKDDDCPTHSSEYALGGDCNDTIISGDIKCSACKFVFATMEELIKLSRSWDSSLGATEVLGDCLQRYYKYMGHRMRVTQQKNSISSLMAETKESCTAEQPISNAVVTIDYKMKQEDRYYRESSVMHYGKRGEFNVGS